MLMKRWQILSYNLKIYAPKFVRSQQRNASALYVSGDKATENTPPLTPHLDFNGTFSNLQQIEESIKYRNLKIDLKNILAKYENYKTIKMEMANIEEQRQKTVAQLKALSKDADKEKQENLKALGKDLRNQLKSIKERFYPIDDDFVHDYLSIPNILHPQCPTNGHDRLIYQSPVERPETGEKHLKNENLFLLQDNDIYYMFEEAALFDVDCTHAFSDHMVVNGKFIQTSNPDFARTVILEAIATPLSTYHHVLEKDLKNKLNTAHLVGGGAFESYLPDIAKLCVYPSVLPLRYAGFGRNYRLSEFANTMKSSNLYTVTQNNCVNSFVATETAQEADAEMEKILNLAIDFYKELGIHFRITYSNASKLTISECLKANIEVYSPAEKQYIVVGHISNYSNFVSKRLLFTCQKNKKFEFLHIVGGPVVYVTRLIAALVENQIPLDNKRLLCHFDVPDTLKEDDEPFTTDPEDFIKNGIDIYKGVLK